MIKYFTIAAAGALLVSACAVTPKAEIIDNELAAKAATTQSPYKSLNWYPTDFGPEVSPVSGDLSAGQHITLVRFKAGMKSAIHTHNHDYVGVVVSGNGQHYEVDRPETQINLPSGSHWSVSGGVKHVSTCVGPDECVFALFQNDPFDFTEVK